MNAHSYLKQAQSDITDDKYVMKHSMPDALVLCY